MSLRALARRASRDATFPPHRSTVGVPQRLGIRHAIRGQSTFIATEEGTLAPTTISETLETVSLTFTYYQNYKITSFRSD